VSDQPPVIKPLFSAKVAEAERTAALPPPKPPETPLSSALTTAFRFLYLVLGVLLLAWLASGIRPIEPGMQAVVTHFGTLNRVVGSGLVIAWPRPIEELILVPGPERQLTQRITRLDLTGRDEGAVATGTGLDPRKDGGFALTGDAGVVHLSGTVTYTVSDPRAFILGRERLAPALERVFLAATINACAQRRLDGVIVASPDGDTLAQAESVAQSRERLRSDIVTAANHRLESLALGITVTRVDLTANLPDKARPSFDAVIAADSSARRDIAEAQTAATKLKQEVDAQRQAILTAATAKASETLTNARVTTGRILAVLAKDDPAERQMAITRLYRDRIQGIIRNAAGTVTVPPGESVKLYVQGR
jgi:regulator of protease activity HflC (stomatin/prohibitin superfamily)